MMLILSHIHFKNNFPVIYRAQKASFMCVRGTLVSRLLVLFSDKVYNVLGLHNFCRPAQTNSGARTKFIYEKYYSFFFISFSTSLSFTELPHSPPTLWTEFTKYDPGDILRANCSTQPSKPSSSITFLLNQYAVS